MKVQSRKYIDTIVQKLKDMNIAFEHLVVKSFCLDLFDKGSVLQQAIQNSHS